MNAHARRSGGSRWTTIVASSLWIYLLSIAPIAVCSNLADLWMKWIYLLVMKLERCRTVIPSQGNKRSIEWKTPATVLCVALVSWPRYNARRSELKTCPSRSQNEIPTIDTRRTVISASNTSIPPRRSFLGHTNPAKSPHPTCGRFVARLLESICVLLNGDLHT